MDLVKVSFIKTQNERRNPMDKSVYDEIMFEWKKFNEQGNINTPTGNVGVNGTTVPQPPIKPGNINAVNPNASNELKNNLSQLKTSVNSNIDVNKTITALGKDPNTRNATDNQTLAQLGSTIAPAVGNNNASSQIRNLLQKLTPKI